MRIRTDVIKYNKDDPSADARECMLLRLCLSFYIAYQHVMAYKTVVNSCDVTKFQTVNRKSGYDPDSTLTH